MKLGLEDLRELVALCRDHLPLVERRIVSSTLDDQYDELERRHIRLRDITEREDESKAVEVIGQGASENSWNETDKNLIGRWMLNRFMLDEIASPDDRVFRRLLNWKWVAIWVFLPFAIATGLHLSLPAFMGWNAGTKAGFQWMWGLPFVGFLIANFILLFVFYRKPGMMPGIRSKASLLMPQMVGALFYGVLQSFASDETWSLAVMGNVFVRGLNFVLFLLASYYFIRYVMLKGQSPKVGHLEAGKVLRKRSLGILSLGLWQACTLVTLFSLFMGTVMGGETRADLDQAITQMDFFSSQLTVLLPAKIVIDVTGDGGLRFMVFPWAILTWSVQLFFFGAIFERILQRK